MTGLGYGNVSGLMPSGSKTMIFSSCRISRSSGGSLPDTMTNCLKLGSPSEKAEQEYVCPRHKNSQAALADSSSITSMASIRCVTGPPSGIDCNDDCRKFAAGRPSASGAHKRRSRARHRQAKKRQTSFEAVRRAAAALRSRASSNTASRYFCCFVSSISLAPFPAASAAN